MFRRGGKVNTGIMSGLVDRTKHAENPFVGTNMSEDKLKSSIDSFPLERTLFKIDQKYDIITLDIEKDYLYLHLGTGQKNQILRIYNIKTGEFVFFTDLLALFIPSVILVTLLFWMIRNKIKN